MAVRDAATSLGLGRPGGPAFELDADHLPPLPPRVEEAAYRIVAESLTNVARHARAGRCTVRLAQADGHLRVAITDDGCGAQPAPGGATGTASSRCAVAPPTSAESSASSGPPSRAPP